MYRIKRNDYNKGLGYHPSPRQLRGGSLIDDSAINYGKDVTTDKLKASSDFANQYKSAISDVGMEMPTLKSGSKKDRDTYREQMAIYNKKVKELEKGFMNKYKDEITQNVDSQFAAAGYVKDKNGRWIKPASISDVPWLDKATKWIPGATDFMNRAISSGEQLYNKPNLGNIINAGTTLVDSATAGYNAAKQLADPKKLIKDIAIQQGKKALGMGLPKDYNKIDNHYNGHKKRKLQGNGIIGRGDDDKVIEETKEETKEDDTAQQLKDEIINYLTNDIAGTNTKTHEYLNNIPVEIITEFTDEDLDNIINKPKGASRLETIKTIKGRIYNDIKKSIDENEDEKEKLDITIDVAPKPEIKQVVSKSTPAINPNEEIKKEANRRKIILINKPPNENENNILERHLEGKYTIDELKKKIDDENKEKEQKQIEKEKANKQYYKENLKEEAEASSLVFNKQITPTILKNRNNKIKQIQKKATATGNEYENFDIATQNDAKDGIIIGTGKIDYTNSNFAPNKKFQINKVNEFHTLDAVTYDTNGRIGLKENKNYFNNTLRRYNSKGELEIAYPIQNTKLGNSKDIKMNWIQKDNKQYIIGDIIEDNESLKIIEKDAKTNKIIKEIPVKNVSDYDFNILTSVKTKDGLEPEELTFDVINNILEIAEPVERDDGTTAMMPKDNYTLASFKPNLKNYPDTEEGEEAYDKDFKNWQSVKIHFDDYEGDKTFFVPKRLTKNRFNEIKK